jgi:hypothetical protein
MTFGVPSKDLSLCIEAADEAELIEMQGVPVIHAHGIAKAEVEGDEVTLTFFRYRTIGGVRVREPVLEMVRPLRSVASDEVRDMIAQAIRGRRSH